MEAAVLIGVDQGTTNTKAVAVRGDRRVMRTVERANRTRAPRSGWVEQDSEEILAGVVGCIRELLADPAISASVAGLGLCNQTETLIVWDAATGAPLMPAIVWQDRRGDAELAALREAGIREELRLKTGLDLDPTFTAGKLRWLFRHQPELADGLRSGSLLFGTVDCWLVWKLTGGAVYATDASNASRTMLLDLGRLDWDDALLAAFELSIARLPQVRRSTGPFGATRADIVGAEIPITGVLGDQQASLFGHGCVAPGEMKITYGTGAFLWLNAGRRPDFPVAEGLLRTVAWHLDEPTYAAEGFLMQAGGALEWVARRLQLAGGGKAVAEAAQAADGSGGAILVPAFQGLAAPWWSPSALGALLGLSESIGRGEICHAALESVCFQVRAVFEVLAQSTEGRIGAIRADGGPTRSGYLMQLQADILDRPIAISGRPAVGAYGAALMAGLGAGVWSGPEALRQADAPERIVAPEANRDWGLAYRRWRRATDTVVALHRDPERRDG